VAPGPHRLTRAAGAEQLIACHFLELADAATVPTEAYLLTRRTVTDLHDAAAMGAVHGEAGTGKTFPVEEALATSPTIEACSLSFPSQPTMRLVATTLLSALTRSASPACNRFEATALLIDALSHGRRLIVVDEAQRLNRECIELLRHLHDHPLTTFALLLVGGDGCWEVLSREPMLRSRICRRVVFRPLSRRQVLARVHQYHPLFRAMADELLVEATLPYLDAISHAFPPLGAIVVGSLCRANCASKACEAVRLCCAHLPAFGTSYVPTTIGTPHGCWLGMRSSRHRCPHRCQPRTRGSRRAWKRCSTRMQTATAALPPTAAPCVGYSRFCCSGHLRGGHARHAKAGAGWQHN